MKTAFFIVAGLLSLLMSARWGGFWLGVFLTTLLFFRRDTSHLLFSAVAFLFGILYGTLSNQLWWQAGLSLWLPITGVFVLSTYWSIGSSSLLLAAQGGAAMVAWLILHRMFQSGKDALLVGDVTSIVYGAALSLFVGLIFPSAWRLVHERILR